MNFLNAFIVTGIACFIGQLILDNTKLTPGHLTSLFTVVGAFLGFIGVYEKLISYAGGGATVLISNFGYLLYKGAMTGFQEQGIIGLFGGMLATTSVALVSVVVFSFILILIFKPKD